MNYINLHLKELKFSLIYSFITITSLIIVVYDYIEIFLSYYISFTGTNINLIFTDLMEVFYINIKFSILFGVIFSLPFIMFIALLYIKPGLYTYENTLINRFIFITNLIVLPSIIYWIPHLTLDLITYFNDLSYNQWNYYEVELLQRFKNFYNWIFYFNIISILLTIIPLIIMMIIIPKRYVFIWSTILNNKISDPLEFSLLKKTESQHFYKCRYTRGTEIDTPVTISIWLRSSKKYIYLAVLLGIAIITPPDILSLIMLFAPVFIVCELITYIICIFNNIRRIKN